MKRSVFVLFLAFVGISHAYDSLNVRLVWSMGHTSYNMVMDNDTNVWFVEWETDNLIKVEVSNPLIIDTVLYNMDSLLTMAIGVVQDSILLVEYNRGSNRKIYSINIHSNPPEFISSFVDSTHLLGYTMSDYKSYLKDSLYITRDRYNSDSLLAFYNIADPLNIDTYATQIKATNARTNNFCSGYSFAIKDSALYLVYCKDYSPYIDFWPKFYVSVINIADYRHPVFINTFSFDIDGEGAHAEVGAPCVVVDSFLYIGNNIAAYMAAFALNISDPFNPVYRGAIGSLWVSSAGEDVQAIAYQNGYLYVGPQIFNISTSPVGDSLVGYHYNITRYRECLIPFYNYIFALMPEFSCFDFFEYSQVFEPNIKLPPLEYKFHLSPNPTSRFQRITLNKSLISPELFDITGKKYSISNRTIDASKLAAGVYLLKGNIGGQRVVKKIVVE
jgi:hypothetical protein